MPKRIHFVCRKMNFKVVACFNSNIWHLTICQGWCSEECGNRSVVHSPFFSRVHYYFKLRHLIVSKVSYTFCFYGKKFNDILDTTYSCWIQLDEYFGKPSAKVATSHMLYLEKNVYSHRCVKKCNVVFAFQKENVKLFAVGIN